MKKVVFKVDFPHDKGKQEVVKKLSGLLDGTRWLWRWGSCNGTPTKAIITGVDSIAMDMKDKKLTMIGDIDPLAVGAKLRKVCHTEIVTVGPAKEPDKKKEEPKKEEPNKKVVFKVDFRDDEGKQDAVKKVSGLLNGVDSFEMDMKDKKLTMIGDIDPVAVANKLRKACPTDIVMVTEPEKKKNEPKKERKQEEVKEPDKKKEPKKEGAQEGKKAGGNDKKDVRRRKM